MARVWQGDHDHNHYNNPYSTVHPTPASQSEQWCDVSSVASQVLRPGAGTVAGWLLPSPLPTPTFTLFKAASCAPPGQCPVSGHLWVAFATLHAARSLGPGLDASMKFS